MAGIHRLFFALWPDDALRCAIARLRHGPSVIASGRPTRADRLHLTLQFLGDFSAPEGVVERAIDAAGSIEPPSAFELMLDRLGSFGGGRVLWLGTSASPMGLGQLHRRLGDALDARGLRPTHAEAFVPHVTVARDTGGPVEGAVTVALRWDVREFVFVDSTAGAYRILERWPLPG